MSFEIAPVYFVYALAAVSAVLFAEGAYLLCYSATSYRNRINRRLALLHELKDDRQSILVRLRRERGLTTEGNFRLPIISLNRLIVQSGVSGGLTRIALFAAIGMLLLFAGIIFMQGSIVQAITIAPLSGLVLPSLTLRMLRARRQKKFSTQFPDAIDIIVRSLRAGHPVPIAVAMVARELADPIGSEFGIVADEVTYGADLETAMRNLYSRVGQDDLPLFVTAVSIQGSTGGNLGEILQNLSSVIRQRFKMRRKVKALAAEGRASAIILSSLPIGMFAIIQVISPDFYGSVWRFDLTKTVLAMAIGWMLIGNFAMYKLVNFKI